MDKRRKDKEMKKTLNQEQTAWLALREIYTLIGQPDGQIIVKELLKGDKRPTELAEIVDKPQSIYILLKGLTLCQVIDRHLNDDRTVVYSLSPFGRNVLELSEQLVNKIGKEFSGKKSLLLEKN